tara:strand:+ start:1414 stop:1746 length:333 start_codon:yes stop_codon:yes gene_type:complete
MTSKEAFEKLKAKTGDVITMHRACKTREGGWGYRWVPMMDKHVGQEVKIREVVSITGSLRIEGCYCVYPALAFINPEDPEKRKAILDKIRTQNKKKNEATRKKTLQNSES